MTFRQLVIDGIVEWVDAEEEEDLFIAPRPYKLPEVVPEGNEFAGRPVTSENVEWSNLGEPGSNEAILTAKVRMPNGEWESSTFSVPLEFDEITLT